MGRGFGITAAVSASIIDELAREAERLGYSSFWVNDMPGADGLAALAAAAASTSGIQLGVGVLPLDERPAATIADQLRSDGLPVERVLLGVGSGASRDALARVRVGVEALERVVDCRVIVGALGPRMAALAGGVADGVLLNWLTPEYAEAIGHGVLDAATAAGRSRPSLLAYVRCGLLPGAEDRLSEELARYIGVRPFERHLARMGADARDTCVFAADGATLQATIARYEAVLDETIVRAITPDDGVDSLMQLLHACAPPRARGRTGRSRRRRRLPRPG